MSRIEPNGEIQAKVGAERHETAHIGHASMASLRVYVLHSAACVARGIDLRTCEYSLALDVGIDHRAWAGAFDVPVLLRIGARGDLLPVRDGAGVAVRRLFGDALDGEGDASGAESGDVLCAVPCGAVGEGVAEGAVSDGALVAGALFHVGESSVRVDEVLFVGHGDHYTDVLHSETIPRYSDDMHTTPAQTAPTVAVELTQAQLLIVLAALDDFEQTVTDASGDVAPVSAVYGIIDAAVAR